MCARTKAARVSTVIFVRAQTDRRSKSAAAAVIAPLAPLAPIAFLLLKCALPLVSISTRKRASSQVRLATPIPTRKNVYQPGTNKKPFCSASQILAGAAEQPDEFLSRPAIYAGTSRAYGSIDTTKAPYRACASLREGPTGSTEQQCTFIHVNIITVWEDTGTSFFSHLDSKLFHKAVPQR